MSFYTFYIRHYIEERPSCRDCLIALKPDEEKCCADTSECSDRLLDFVRIFGEIRYHYCGTWFKYSEDKWLTCVGKCGRSGPGLRYSGGVCDACADLVARGEKKFGGIEIIEHGIRARMHRVARSSFGDKMTRSELHVPLTTPDSILRKLRQEGVVVNYRRDSIELLW